MAGPCPKEFETRSSEDLMSIVVVTGSFLGTLQIIEAFTSGAIKG